MSETVEVKPPISSQPFSIVLDKYSQELFLLSRHTPTTAAFVPIRLSTKLKNELLTAPVPTTLSASLRLAPTIS